MATRPTRRSTARCKPHAACCQHNGDCADGDICTVDLEGRQVDGRREPSVETAVHLAVYRAYQVESRLRSLGRRPALYAIDRTGVVYHPLADRWQRSTDMDVNYMVLAEKGSV